MKIKERETKSSYVKGTLYDKPTNAIKYIEKHYPEKTSYLQLLMEMVEKEMDNFEPKNKEVLKERLRCVNLISEVLTNIINE